MEKTRIHLCRHGEVDPSWAGKIYGGHDVALAPRGEQRFDELAQSLATLTFDAIYCSDLSRAADGARRIAAHHDLDVRVDPRFREIDRGEWVGLTLDEIEARWPGGTDAYMRDPERYREHGGENHEQVRDRVFPALQEICDRHPRGESLVVCHGQVMRIVVAHVLGIPGDRSLNVMTGHGGLTTLDRFEDGEWVVQAVNAPTIRSGAWGGRTFKP